MKLLFYSKPLVVPVPKDWADGQLLGASQPRALVIRGLESQLALGSAQPGQPLGTALGECGTDGGSTP